MSQSGWGRCWGWGRWLWLRWGVGDGSSGLIASHMQRWSRKREQQAGRWMGKWSYCVAGRWRRLVRWEQREGGGARSPGFMSLGKRSDPHLNYPNI